MTSDSAFVLLIISWVISYGAVAYVFTSNRRHTKDFYKLLAGISAFFALIAYICYYLYFLPFY